MNDALRELPSVHEVLESLPTHLRQLPHAILVDGVRRVIDAVRADIRSGVRNAAATVMERIEQELAPLLRPSQRRVINATGVVLHTNLGRAPLGDLDLPGGYSNLEYDLVAGQRGKRDTHTGRLLEALVGAPGIIVNNNAAAIFLALHELAAGHEVVVSRGELIEIGDGFRIPEIMARSGAILREVGTTNRTRIDDYRAAINDHTRLLLRVHPSNFRMEGFTARPSLQELSALAREREVPFYEDLGSGCVLDLRDYGIDEPPVQESLRAGVDLVSFSGDKLLGGPQAGILAGRQDLVVRLRRNPLFRALRADKLIYQTLELTLRRLVLQQWDAVPALRMIRESKDAIRQRAERLLERIPGVLLEGESVAGGGSTPGQRLPTWLIAIATADVVKVEARLRQGEPPVLARIDRQQLLLDLRTVFPGEEDALAAAIAVALSSR